MPNEAILLRPGVNLEQTQALNQAGISQSQSLRFKDGLAQTLGGWERIGSVVIPSTIRDIHIWQGISGSQHIGVGATQNLQVVTSGSNTDITPETSTTNPAPNFSISSGSNVVTVTDGSAVASIYNTVYFNTPVAVGTTLLNGAYRIIADLGGGVYTIESSGTSDTTVASSGILPIFTTSSGDAAITVTLPNNNYLALPGLYQQFIAPTNVGDLTVEGPYNVLSVIDSTNFVINAVTQATSADTQTMNGGLAQLVYYITDGAPPSGSGFGAGGFGDGGFGTGVSGGSGGSGTPITATDWTLDNWGGTLLACPIDGPIFTWDANSGFTNTQVISNAPFFNGGIFVAMPYQILVAWRSCLSTGVQDNLTVRWCDAENYDSWEVADESAAGSFKISKGSVIVGGLQAQNFGLISTDIGVWQMSYVGGDVTFNFTEVGSGCGWAGPHAAGILAGEVYWCGRSNFFKFGGRGVEVVPCAVWDFIFQNVNTNYLNKINCAPNSAFNEIMWFFPALGSTECNAYVKLNINEGAWDYGLMNRTSWSDISVLGNPIGADSEGLLWQHEEGEELTGAGTTTMQTGWWAITEGNDFAFVDFVMPDFKWGLYGTSNASINLTFFSVDYPGDTPRSYGPYTVTQATPYVTPRIRGRMMSLFIQSNNAAFWRIGRIRYRWGSAGRR